MLNIIIGSLLVLVLIWLFAKLLQKPAKPAKPVQVRSFISDRDYFTVSREFR